MQETWSELDWVDPAERRRARVANTVMFSLLAIGGVPFFIGVVLTGSAIGFVLYLIGSCVLVASAVLAMVVHPYRRVDDSALPETVFHVSTTEWSPGDTVTLEVARCRKKQAITERRWGLRAKLVFVFAQRPTRRHVQGQILGGRRRGQRFLYELRSLHTVDAIYMRGAALAVPQDVTATVVNRQRLGKKRDNAVPLRA